MEEDKYPHKMKQNIYVSECICLQKQPRGSPTNDFRKDPAILANIIIHKWRKLLNRHLNFYSSPKERSHKGKEKKCDNKFTTVVAKGKKFNKWGDCRYGGGAVEIIRKHFIYFKFIYLVLIIQLFYNVLGLLQLILVLYIYIILMYIYKHIVPYITIFSCSWYTFL